MRCEIHNTKMEEVPNLPNKLKGSRLVVCPRCVLENPPETEFKKPDIFKTKPYKTDNKWYIRFMDLAKHISTWSKDPSTKVGSVITDNSKRIVSVGFNGYPQNIPDNDLDNREMKYAKVLHAEMNAILFAQRNLEGCSIYVYPMAPCSRCAAAIIQSGIGWVVTIKATKEQNERWGEAIQITEDMFTEAGVGLIYI